MTASTDRTYQTEDVSLPSGKLQLSGTIRIPQISGRLPAVVLIHGAGPTTRDGGGHLRDVASYFATRGIACLTYDKRGVGGSDGDWAVASLDDLASDAVAGVDVLARRDEIDPHRIGVWGFSQGGWIAPLVAIRSDTVAFVITVSGNGVSPATQEMYRIEEELRADGFSDADIGEAVALRALSHEVLRTHRGRDRLETVYREAWDRGPAWLKYVGVPYSPDELSSLDDHAWRWAREFLFYDPVPTLERVDVPFLAVFGTLDRNTPATESAAIHERSFKGRPHADLTIRFFDGANHGLRVATTGGPKEWNDALPYVAGYFETMADWILART